MGQVVGVMAGGGELCARGQRRPLRQAGQLRGAQMQADAQLLRQGEIGVDQELGPCGAATFGRSLDKAALVGRRGIRNAGLDPRHAAGQGRIRPSTIRPRARRGRPGVTIEPGLIA